MSREKDQKLQFRHWGGLEGGEEGGRRDGGLVLGKCFEEKEEGDDLGGLFLGIKTIGPQPQSNWSRSEHGESSGNEGPSGRASVIKGVSQASPEAAGFRQDLFSCRLIEGKDQFLMLKGCQESHVILIIKDDDRQGGA
jgi:hypothetical protein